MGAANATLAVRHHALVWRHASITQPLPNPGGGFEAGCIVPVDKLTPLDVDSPRNAEIKALLKLKDRRHRDREGLFLIEGRREVTRAVQANVRIRTLYVCPSLPAPAGMKQLANSS